MREILRKIATIEDPVKRRAVFMAVLSKEIANRGGATPIVVGGEALELYTQGSYSTGDIDIKSPLEMTKAVLEEWGFEKKTRTWFSRDLDIYVDWLGASLDEGPEAEKRITTIVVGDGQEIRVVSVEDLIVDRLNAAKVWGDVDSLMWARVLLHIKNQWDERVDLEYLQKRAQEQDLTEYLTKILVPPERTTRGASP